MLIKLGVLTTLLVLVSTERVRFDNYTVYRVIPANSEQYNSLYDLTENSQYTFWSGLSSVNVPVDVMVPPSKTKEFHQLMKQSNFNFSTFIEDVQQRVDEESRTTSAEIRQGSNLGWNKYHTLEEIYAWLDSLAVKYPEIVEVVIGGRTYEGRQIKGVKVSFKPGNPGVFIEGNIHAREWITSATVTYILNELLTSKDPNVRELADSHDWYIFPVVNPDGFAYTHTTNRLWRKTRTPYGYRCRGADPNRNWDYKWNQGGASSLPCLDTYAGAKAFSDIETRTLSKYITSISSKFYAYIAFHSYSQLLLFPYGHTEEHLDNYDQLYQIGKKTIAGLAKRYGTQYVTGNIAETIYVATGNSMDWVKSNYHPEISFTYELRDKGRYGFILPANQIIPTGEETLDSLVTMFKEAKALGIPKTKNNSSH